MEKGHIELGEILFVALLVIGLATAIILLVDGNGNPAAAPTAPDNSSQNSTPSAPSSPANASKNGTADASIPDAVPVQTMNKSMGVLVDEGLGRADAWFNSTGPQGNFNADTYGWAMGVANQSPDAIPVKENDLRAVEVRFGGRYDDALRAFAFRQYTSPTLSEYPRLYAIAIFISNSTLVDSSGKVFDMQFDPYPEGPQILEDCTVLNTTAYATPGGSPVKVYDISCKIMYGVYP